MTPHDGKLQDYVVAMRRDLHSHPELSLKEYRTAERIEEELERMGIAHKRIGATGVLGVIRGRLPGSGIAVLRADIDALPMHELNETEFRSRVDGIMHACGHDAHTACLLGAARVLKDNRDRFGGEVRLVFQPGEETGDGAREFVEAGVLDGATRVFGLHTAHNLPAGTVGIKSGLNNASVDHFAIHVQGKSSHVSSPQLGTDAAYIASHIVVSLQALATRRVSPTEPVIVGVGKLAAGTTYNALAETADIEGTVRAVSQSTRQNMKHWVPEIAERTSELYGGRAEVVWKDYASPLINDENVCSEAERAARLLGADASGARPLSMGGDNFADFLQCAPGAFLYLGTANPDKPHTTYPSHSSRFDIDEDVLPLGARLYAALALQSLDSDAAMSALAGLQ